MDAGVPIRRPVSGIAMGLVKEDDEHVITDIQGAEDHLGDMDFKVAGSRQGITALQMDIKITGVTQEIMRNALDQAKRAREFILDRMAEAISESREGSRRTRLGSRRSRSIPSRSGSSSARAARRSAASSRLRGPDRHRGGRDDPHLRTEGEKADAAIAAIQGLTKEPEVGDVHRQGGQDDRLRRLRRAEEGH